MLTSTSSFLIFFLLFFLALETAELDYINIYEAAYMIYALGFSLEKIAAMQEHGIRGERKDKAIQSLANTIVCSLL